MPDVTPAYIDGYSAYNVTIICRQCGTLGHAAADCPYIINTEQTIDYERLLACTHGHIPFRFNSYGGCPLCKAGIRVQEDHQSEQGFTNLYMDTPGGTRYVPETDYDRFIQATVEEGLARQAEGNCTA